MNKANNNLYGLVFDSLNYIILTLLLILTVYPFYYIFIYSISDAVLAQKGIVFLPAGFSLKTYIGVFKLRGIPNAALVSLLRTLIGTVLTVGCSAFFAYLVTKKELFLRKVIYRFVIISMYFNAGFIPWYITMKALGLKNNFMLYVLPSAVIAFYVILIKTFIEQLPQSLEESARIDGAGYIKVFAKIIFPISMPIIATIMVFSAVGQWNSWIDNFFLVENPDLMTLQLILYQFLSQANAIASRSMQELSRGILVKTLTPQSIKMGITMVVTLPVLMVYPFMQRYFIKGIMLGAVKG